MTMSSDDPVGFALHKCQNVQNAHIATPLNGWPVALREVTPPKGVMQVATGSPCNVSLNSAGFARGLWWQEGASW